MDDYYDDYYGGYEDEEPNVYHGTYSEEQLWLAWNTNALGVGTSGRTTDHQYQRVVHGAARRV